MFWESFELWVAAFLMANHVPYRGCALTKNDKILFRFAPDERIKKLVDSYHFGASIGAKDLSQAYKFLSDQIRQARQNGGTAK